MPLHPMIAFAQSSPTLFGRSGISRPLSHQKDSTYDPAWCSCAMKSGTTNRVNRRRCVAPVRQIPEFWGAPGRIRTCDARLRSSALCFDERRYARL